MEIRSPLGSIEYWFVRTQDRVRCHKTVHFYLMIPTGGDFSCHDPEFDDVHWWPEAEALNIMTHSNEVELVKKGASDCARRGGAGMKPEIIRAGKVILRPKRSEDAEDDYAWRCDEELAELDATTPLMQPFRQFLRYYEDDLKHSSPWSMRLAIDDLDGKHIGNVMCYDINAHFGEAELGIMIGNRNYWNKSFGYHTMVGLIDHIFRTTDLKRLYLHTLDWNVRAQSSFQRCGFRSVRTVPPQWTRPDPDGTHPRLLARKSRRKAPPSQGGGNPHPVPPACLKQDH